MQGSFEILNWDSDFFGVKVAQVEKNCFSEENKGSLLKQLKDEEVELAYYISDGPFENNENDLYKFIQVNRRVPIKKKLSGPVKIHKNISSYEQNSPSSELINLAQRAADWSRFKFDPNISSGKVKDLYDIWISNSVKKGENSDLLIYKEEGKILGFVTLSFHPPKGTTPLFAVSREAEGKGVSFALMRAADTFLYQKGCTYYTSATQADNRTAVTVFKRHGFEISPVEYVYHLWKK